MTSAFYRKAVGAFVVTDVTQPNGFETATLWKKDLDMKLRMHDDSLVPSVLLINKVCVCVWECDMAPIALNLIAYVCFQWMNCSAYAQCDGEAEDGKRSNTELNPVKVDHYCRQHKFSGWFDTSAKNDINIEEAVQFLVGKVSQSSPVKRSSVDDGFRIKVWWDVQVLASETNETQVAISNDDLPNISLTSKVNRNKKASCCWLNSIYVLIDIRRPTRR